ncbi:MAG TPA: ribosome maturation factor RimP [Rhodanobacteraceae bacterium]
MPIFCFCHSWSDMDTQAIATRIAPALAELGLACLGVEWNAGSGGGLLRVYIDVTAPNADAAKQVGVDECEAASREISALLDVDDPIPGRYTLEVSSPGLERPLFNAAQFARFIGSDAKVTLKLPRNGRRRLKGRIAEAAAMRIGLDVDGTRIEVAEGEIESAHLVPDWDALGYTPKPKPGKGGKAGKSARKR